MEKIKIGITTFYNAHNYGAMLQAFALCKYLNKKYDAELINYYDRKVYKQYQIIRPLCKNPVHYMKGLTEDLINYQKKKKRFQLFDNFLNKNCKLSKRYTNEKELKNSKMDYNVMITGSDQVWNTNIVGKLSDIYTLNFGEESINRISYAASIGDISQVAKLKEIYQNKLSKLNYISVREEEAKEALDHYLEQKIEVVLDPTLLLTRKEWDEIIPENRLIKERYILAYCVKKNEEYIKIVNELSDKTGLKVVYFDLEAKELQNKLQSVYSSGPLEFINYIKNAEYIITTSFHATVFSIIYNKKFFVIPHKNTGSRVTNLLYKIGIENRDIKTIKEFNTIDYSFSSDWIKINDKLEKERQKSLDWLTKRIEKKKE